MHIIPKQVYVEQLADTDHYKRSQALLGLAYCKGRDIFSLLYPLTFDQEQIVRRDALISLGINRNSRAYFFLANYFFWAKENFPQEENLELQKSILFSFRANKDPRALELVQRATELKGLESLASSVLRVCKRYPRLGFMYEYMGNEEDRENAKQYSGKKIQSQDDLQSLDAILEEEFQWSKNHFEKPQTYIVNTEEDFLLGGELHEHVQVASGEDVLAAGEAYLEKQQDGLWHIRELNNRSNGYYPHHSCFRYVKKALEKTDIPFPSSFSHEYPQDGWLDSDLLAIHKSGLFQKKK